MATVARALDTTTAEVHGDQKEEATSDYGGMVSATVRLGPSDPAQSIAAHQTAYSGGPSPLCPVYCLHSRHWLLRVTRAFFFMTAS